MRCKTYKSATLHQGSTLIEVMIAVIILGVGLLGIAALQTTALRNSQSSLERTQAVIQSYSIIDAMRANRNAALSNEYNLSSMTCEAPSSGTLAQTDVSQWIASLNSTLGGANTCGQINCNGGVCTVTVQWDDSRASDAGDDGAIESGSETMQITTVVVL